MKLSSRVQNLQESKTLAMARLANELKEQGKNIINMSLGEPDFYTPDFIKVAAKKAIDDNFSFYSPVNGFKDLREAISYKLKRDNQLDFSAEQIIVSTGAKQSLANLVLALINPGDEVVLPAPFWVSYKDQINFIGGKVIEIPTSIEANFKITAEQLENALNDKTKLFIFSSPCNPTGSSYTQQELADLVDVFKKYPDVIICSDEIYELINFDHQHFSIGTFKEIAERVVIVNGVSKGFAMTGWRLGYMAGPLALIKACTKIQGQFTSGTCSITQKAAIAALASEPSEVNHFKKEFQKRRDLILERLEKIPGFACNRPGGAFYLFPKISSFYDRSYNNKPIKDSLDFSMFLLDQAQVATTPGEAFGAADNIRLSYALGTDDIEEACRRIKKACLQLC